MVSRECVNVAGEEGVKVDNDVVEGEVLVLAVQKIMSALHNGLDPVSFSGILVSVCRFTTDDSTLFTFKFAIVGVTSSECTESDSSHQPLPPPLPPFLDFPPDLPPDLLPLLLPLGGDGLSVEVQVSAP